MQEVSGSSPLSSTLVAPILTKPDLIERLGFLLAAAIAASFVSIRRIFDSYSSPPSHFILAEVAPLRNRGPRPSSDSPDRINFPDWIDDPIARASTSLAEKKGDFLPGAILPSTGTSKFDIDEIRPTFLIGGTIATGGCLFRRKLLFFMIDIDLRKTSFWSLRDPLGRRVVSANE
jgi:hypothetical protein